MKGLITGPLPVARSGFLSIRFTRCV